MITTETNHEVELPESLPNAPTPLPLKIVIICTLSITFNIASITQLYSYLGFLVEDFFPELPKEELGYRGGYIAGAYFIMQLISGPIWGWVTDKFGRKIVLFISMIGSMISVILIGFSLNYPMAIFARALGGFLDSTFPVIKTMIADSTDSSNKNKGFSVIALAYGIGSLIGPLIGGLTSDPQKQYGLSFKLWNAFPYSPPCLLSAFFLGLSALAIYFFLGETKGKAGFQKLNQIELEDVKTLKANDEDTKFYKNNKSNEDENKSDNENENKSDNENENKSDNENENNRSSVDDLNVPLVPLNESQETLDIKNELSENFFQKHQAVILVISAYMFQACIFVAWEEIYPLWSLTPVSSGGLNFQENQIGLTLTIGGIFLIFFQSFAYTRIVDRFGILNTFRSGQLCAALAFLIFPWTSVLANSSVLLWSAIIPLQCLRIMAGTMGFTSINILLVLCEPDNIGKINGISFGLAGFTKAIGPIAGTPILAWSETSGLSWPFNQHFPFILLCTLSILNFGVSFLPPIRTKDFKQESIH